MSRVTVYLCDVKPCNHAADRKFEVNGETVYVCGEGCYIKFWSREYQSWKLSAYNLKAIHLEAQRPQRLQAANGDASNILPMMRKRNNFSTEAFSAKQTAVGSESR